MEGRTQLILQALVFLLVTASVVWVLQSDLRASLQFASFVVLIVVVVVLTWPFTDPVAE